MERIKEILIQVSNTSKGSTSK